MQNGMKLEGLLEKVIRQNDVKHDYVTSTKDNVRMVEDDDQVWLVLLKAGSGEFSRFAIAEQAHRQISYRLGIPWKYYQRCLNDHRDLIVIQVNALFEREPETRLFRVLDGRVRAFLSNRYRTLDNYEVLAKVLPPLTNGDIESQLISSNVGENKMHLKVLFTDDKLAIDLGENPHGKTTNGWGDPGQNVDMDAAHNVIAQRDAGRRIVRPGIRLSNSETGQGGLNVEGFLFDSYCLNGLVWGVETAFKFSRNHIGGRLIEGVDFEVFTDETKRKQDEVIMAEVADALAAMVDPERVRAMGERLHAIKDGEKAGKPVAAVEAIAEVVELTENEQASVLETFLKDGDYSQWGMVSAVTEVANTGDYARACELETIGAKIIDLDLNQWAKIARAEPVLIAA